MLFAVLSLSAGCVEESMDIFHAIALHQALPCALEEQKLWKDGTTEQRGSAASDLPCCYLLQSACFLFMVAKSELSIAKRGMHLSLMVGNSQSFSF